MGDLFEAIIRVVCVFIVIYLINCCARGLM